MLAIDNLSKESVHTIMLKHLIVMNLAWFNFENLIRTKSPAIMESKEYMKIMEEYASGQVKALTKALNIRDNGIDSLIKLLESSHWAIFEHIKVSKLTEQSCSMQIIGCSTQRAAQKWGMGHYICAEPTLACLKGFCNQVNPQMIVEKVFAPPDVSPHGTHENISCEWLITLKEK